MIVFQGYRCERCEFNFHKKCWGKVPTLCEPEQLQYDINTANQLRNVLSRYNQTTNQDFSGILDNLLPSDPARRNKAASAANYDQKQDSTTESPYPRDRSSSAPNINVIKDEFNCQELQTLQTNTPNSLHSSGQQFHDVLPTSSTSTVYLMGNTLTPPQSAPPQKTSQTFFVDPLRLRSKSPSGSNVPSPNNIKKIEPASSAASLMMLESANGSRFELKRQGGERFNKRRGAVEDWEISIDKIVFKEPIGCGSFGTVYKAYYFGEEDDNMQRPVAVKKLNIRNPGPELLSAFKNEVTVLRRARHGNVLNFLGVIREPDLAIVTQWCQGSSLYRHIHVVEPHVDFEMKAILEICKQIAQGMCYLHSRNVIHRDLKSNNIFLTDDTTVKIGDFGLATVKARPEDKAESNPNPSGSILWMPPEVIRMQIANPYSNRSDVYSFGIVLYELLSSTLPYVEYKSRDQILFLVGSGRLKPDMKKLRNDVPKRFRALLDNCINYKQEDRPEFPEIFDNLNSIRLPTLKRSASEPNFSTRSQQQQAT
ncbi:Non-specific serine/threonine protein kinase [Aphelenchoides bicaudatus]|nr:Non-specific serine/threonine protein kinase [Aphelenchoides bicaudatus]